jgi:hypothetical protein
MEMTLSVKDLEEMLRDLVLKYRAERRMGKGGHEEEIVKLENWANDLSKSPTDAKKLNILAQLGEMFIQGRDDYQKKGNVFIDKLNNLEHKKHTFYRGIGLILKEHAAGGNFDYSRGLCDKLKSAEEIKTEIASQPKKIEAERYLPIEDLKTYLNHLIWLYKDQHPVRGMGLFKSGGGKHRREIEELEAWTGKLKSGNQEENAKHIIGELKTWFQNAEDEYKKKFFTTGDFINNKLNLEPGKHTFYREIGLILKENYKNDKDYYDRYSDIKELADFEKKASLPRKDS